MLVNLLTLLVLEPNKYRVFFRRKRNGFQTIEILGIFHKKKYVKLILSIGNEIPIFNMYICIRFK